MWVFLVAFALLARTGLAEDTAVPSEPDPSQAIYQTFHMDELVVTPGRIEQQLRDVPAYVTVLGPADVRESAAITVDDLLRQVPGFSLFRRSSSVVANPTTQGVSLRGIGPSGVSRTLVLVDGVPLNDPFGGWVYWSRIPKEAVERIEVLRGGGSTLWGNYALGGVIDIITRGPEPRAGRFTAEGGNRGTVNFDGRASDVSGPFGFALEGSFFDTDGYPVVREDQRGPIDIEADAKHGLFRGRADYSLSGGSKLSLHGGYFSEERSNGTPLTKNSTRTGDVGAEANTKSADGSDWKLVAFSQLQGFESTFSSQAADRSSEVPALDQFDVPSSSVGSNLQWARTVLDVHRLTAGTDFRWIDGETHENFRFMEGRFTMRRDAGGEQQIIGAYAQEIYEPLPRWQVTAGVRGDVWRNYDTFRREQSLDTGETTRDDSIGNRDRFAVSPKVALRFHATDELSARGSFYEAFRVPTLNELVRPFRVRNDITEANPGLDPERLLGGEIGADYARSALLGRLTGFWNEVTDPIANVTIGNGPGVVAPCGFVPEGGVCRQRQNLDRTRIRGIEAEIDVIPSPSWTGTASYLFDEAAVRSAPNQRDLEGKRIAQVPEHQVVLRLAYANPAIVDANVQVRWVGDQFEDDLNALVLGDFAVVDLFVGRAIHPGWDVFVSVENLFDRTYEAGKTADGIVTIGSPVLVHGGLRVRF